MTEKTSRWWAQMGALGFDSEAARSAEAQAEARAMATMKLRQLELPDAPAAPARRHARHWTALAGVAVAAALALILWPSKPQDLLRPKGGDLVTVDWERDGTVRPFAAGDVLANGDRVLASVDAVADGYAYWLVVDAHGAPQVDAKFIEASALPLTAGTRATFAQSIRLVGEPVGETLVVYVCVEPHAAEKILAGSPAGCDATTTKLR